MPEQIDCTPKALLEASKCYSCIDPSMQTPILIMLLNSISGLNLTPNQLSEQAKCFTCMDKKMQQAAVVFLLCQIAVLESA